MNSANPNTKPTSDTQTTPRRPFKKLYCDWRKRLFELSGAQLRVWLYHYLRSNKEDQSWPSVAGIVRDTKLHRDTVIEARKKLFASGWLVKIEDANFKTCLVIAAVPDQSENPTGGSRKIRQSEIPDAGNSDQGGSEIPDTGKFRHEVDTVFEVDCISGGDTKKQVDIAQYAVPTADCASTGYDFLAAAAAKIKPSSNRRSEKLSANIQGRIAEEDTYPYWIDYCKKKGQPHPFGDEERQAFAEIGYTPDLTSPLLTYDFVAAVTIVCDEHRGKGVSPGNLCSKIIDYCDREMKSDLTEGFPGTSYYWPPNFQDHRNTLRAEERQLESKFESASVMRTGEPTTKSHARGAG